MKSNFMEVHNVIASPRAKKSNGRKLQRVTNGDSLFTVRKQRPTRKHRWYHGNAECGGVSKAAPWAFKNNLPGYESLSAYFASGDHSLDSWLESKGINRPDQSPQLEGIDIGDFRDHMSQPSQRLWYKK